jgi:hypothetical protein
MVVVPNGRHKLNSNKLNGHGRLTDLTAARTRMQATNSQPPSATASSAPTSSSAMGMAQPGSGPPPPPMSSLSQASVNSSQQQFGGPVQVASHARDRAALHWLMRLLSESALGLAYLWKSAKSCAVAVFFCKVTCPVGILTYNDA